MSDGTLIHPEEQLRLIGKEPDGFHPDQLAGTWLGSFQNEIDVDDFLQHGGNGKDTTSKTDEERHTPWGESIHTLSNLHIRDSDHWLSLCHVRLQYFIQMTAIALLLLW